MTAALRERLSTALGATYQIDDELAGGGMSHVFVATERALGRKVVIKVLPPELAAGVNRERFQREIQVAAQLQHPHIVPLLSAGESGDLLWYAMPFIEGESLRTAIARRGRLPVRDVVRILHDVVEALAYAHRRGVVHRDIKPGNILTIGSRALVTDFGVAKAVSAAMPTSGFTSAGMAIGTPAYMAPEQLAADPEANHRMDIYAVGLLAYELLTGKSPFVGTSPQATMAAQLTRVPEPLDTVRGDVPRGLSAVIMRCLEKLPENRLQTADALLEELDAIAMPTGAMSATAPLPATAAVPESVVPAATPSRSRARVQRRALIAGALLIGAGGTAVAFEFFERVDSNRPLIVVGEDSARGVPLVPGPRDPDSTAPPAAASASAGATPPAQVATAGTRPPIMLTRAESLAIAEAIRKRVDAQRDSQVVQGRRRVVADSQLVHFERAFGDSLARAIAALRLGHEVQIRGLDKKELEHFRELARMSAKMAPAPAPGPAPQRPRVVVVPGAPPEARTVLPPPAPGIRRVVLGAVRNATGRRGFDALSAPILDSLLRALVRRDGYEAVPATMLGERRAQLTRGGVALARAAGAGAIVSGLYYLRADSVIIQVQVFDVHRNHVFRALESSPADPADPLQTFGALVARTLAALDEVEWITAPTTPTPPR